MRSAVYWLVGVPCLAEGTRVSAEASKGQLSWQPCVSVQHCAHPATDTPDRHHAHYYQVRKVCVCVRACVRACMCVCAIITCAI